MERGPRYKAYADLRESKLRLKFYRMEEYPIEEPTPLKKQVRIQESLIPRRKGLLGSSSVLTQSVPDFSATLRKENRKPILSPVMELTPPMKRSNGVLSSSRGSKSANAGEKQGFLMARKSYANVEELKGLATNVNNAINGENRGRAGLRSSIRVSGRSKTVYGL
ncbi:hypothetical protein ACFE04_005658 [Oxalis oulophora]